LIAVGGQTHLYEILINNDDRMYVAKGHSFHFIQLYGSFGKLLGVYIAYIPREI
jgi:hypothetical protein